VGRGPTPRLVREFRFPRLREPRSPSSTAWARSLRSRGTTRISTCYGKVRVELWTHAIDGLTEMDFVLAARTDRLWDSAGRRTF